MSTVSDKFDVSSKGAYSAIKKVLTSLTLISSSIIKWPTVEECLKIEQDCRDVCGFPGMSSQSKKINESVAKLFTLNNRCDRCNRWHSL